MQELELELHQQEEIPNEIPLPVEEISITPVSNGRNTRGKDISSTYSSFIPKGRDKATVTTSIQQQVTNMIKSDNVFLFISIY